MAEALRGGCVAALLVINSVTDLKRREVNLGSLFLFGILGVGLNAAAPCQSLGSAAGGIGLGLALLALSAWTHGMMGRGDGLLLLVVGIYLGFEETFAVFTGGLLGAAIVSAAGLLSGRLKRKDSLPFVPFLCAAFFLRL